MTTIKDIKETAEIYAEFFFNKDPDARSQLAVNIEKDFIYDRSRKTNWVKERKISAHHLSYDELS